MNFGQGGCKSHLCWCCIVAFLVLAVSPCDGMGEEGIGKAATDPDGPKFSVQTQFVALRMKDLRHANFQFTFARTNLPRAVADVIGSPAVEAADAIGAAVHISPDLPANTRTGTSRVAIEKTAPLTFAVLDENRATELIARWQADHTSNILSGPKMTVNNGQSGCISDVSQTPFVIGVRDSRPQIRVVTEGTIIKIQPQMKSEGTVRLALAVRFSRIRGVETATATDASSGKPWTIQVPEVATMRLEGVVKVPTGKWLVLVGPDFMTEKRHDESWVVTLANGWLGSAGLKLTDQAEQSESSTLLTMLRVEKAATSSAKLPGTPASGEISSAAGVNQLSFRRNDGSQVR